MLCSLQTLSVNSDSSLLMIQTIRSEKRSEPKFLTNRGSKIGLEASSFSSSPKPRVILLKKLSNISIEGPVLQLLFENTQNVLHSFLLDKLSNR